MHKCKRRRTSCAHDFHANIVSPFMLLPVKASFFVSFTRRWCRCFDSFRRRCLFVDACFLASPKRKPKVYAIWKWTLFTCYRKIIIPTELSEWVWQGEGLAIWNIIFQYYVWDDYKFPCMTRAGRTGESKGGFVGWIFAFNNFIFFLLCFLRTRTLPILHISPLKANIRMILHNKQIHPQQTVSGFLQTSQPTSFDEVSEREIVIDTFLLSIFSMNVCLLEHQSIHLIFWFRCVTHRFRLSWLSQHTKTNTHIDLYPCKIYTSPFAYSINVCATVDSLFCVISRLITHSIYEAQVS